MDSHLRYLNFKEKLLNWEYWPFEVVYFPVFIYYLFLALKARSLFFFSASNPSIPTGGLTGESKGDILEKIPSQWIAKTFRIPKGDLNKTQLTKIINEIGFPMIAKPDVGERGTHVRVIHATEDLINHLQKFRHRDFLIQEYISYPLELGIFYYRFPGQQRGIISSVTVKEFLSVTGNGIYTVRQLMEALPRARFHLDRIPELLGKRDNYIPSPNEIFLVEPIGNHSRGTKFINGEAYIDQQLHQVFDTIANSIDGFYFGRFDLRCTNWEDLKAGKNIRIVELNGAGAEPAHIYHPGYSLFKGISCLLFHWKIMYQISTENHKRGVPYMTLKEWNDVQRKTKMK